MTRYPDSASPQDPPPGSSTAAPGTSEPKPSPPTGAHRGSRSRTTNITPSAQIRAGTGPVHRTARLRHEPGPPARPQEDAGFGTWIDDLLARLVGHRGMPAAVALPLFGVGLFLAGLAITLVFGYSSVYVRTLPAYLGVAGFVLVISAIRWMSRRFSRALVGMRPCFAPDDARYRQLEAKWVAHASGSRYFALFLSFFVIFCFAALWVSLAYPDLLMQFGVRSIRPSTFPPEWYEGHLALVATLGLYALACGLALGTGVWLLVVNLAFLFEVAGLRVTPLPALLISRFRTITDIYLVVSLAWAVGVGLFTVLFSSQSDALIYVVLGVLALIGVATFLVPQIVFRHLLICSYDSLADGALAVYDARFKGETGAGVAAALRGVLEGESYTSYIEMAAMAAPTQTWVYDLRDLGLLVIGQLGPLVLVALRGAV